MPAPSAERPDVAYSLLAVDFMSEEALNAALTRVTAGVAKGRLQPLPRVVHSLSSVQAALRQMSQARHVGKIVVRSPALQQQVERGSSGAWAVTGGMGTLGTHVAEWLARQQVRRMQLLGRSGRYSDGGGGLELPQAGSAVFQAAVTLAMYDTSTKEGATDVLATLAGHGAAGLQGFIHAGGVLADGMVSAQSMASLRTVFAPKVQSAALLLEGVSRRHPAASQLLFSSVAALLGSPGQANYSAANALLDAMAEAAQAQVRASALPARGTHGH